MTGAIRIRRGDVADSGLLAGLMNAAGEGIPAYLWSRMAGPETDPIEYGARRVQRSEGAFSYTNTHVALIGDAPAGMLLGYPLPDPYDLASLDDVPEVVRPALELESRVPGSWYVNAVATVESFRRRGVATALLRHAEDLAHAAGAPSVSLIVAEDNEGARRLYDALDFDTVARRATVAFPGCAHEGDWLLLAKTLIR